MPSQLNRLLQRLDAASKPDLLFQENKRRQKEDGGLNTVRFGNNRGLKVGVLAAKKESISSVAKMQRLGLVISNCYKKEHTNILVRTRDVLTAAICELEEEKRAVEEKIRELEEKIKKGTAIHRDKVELSQLKLIKEATSAADDQELLRLKRVMQHLLRIKRLLRFIHTPLYYNDDATVFTAAAHCNLADYLRDLQLQRKSLSLTDIRRLSGQILLGLEALHSLRITNSERLRKLNLKYAVCGFAHLDLKAENILITMDAYGRPHATIGDIDTIIAVDSNNRFLGVEKQQLYFTPGNQPPEFCYSEGRPNERIIDLKAFDIYSFGALLVNGYSKIYQCYQVSDYKSIIEQVKNTPTIIFLIEKEKAFCSFILGGKIVKTAQNVSINLFSEEATLFAKEEKEVREIVRTQGNAAKWDTLVKDVTAKAGAILDSFKDGFPATPGDEKALIAFEELSQEAKAMDPTQRPMFDKIKAAPFFVSDEKFSWKQLEEEHIELYAGDLLIPSGVEKNDKSYVIESVFFDLKTTLVALNDLLEQLRALRDGNFQLKQIHSDSNIKDLRNSILIKIVKSEELLHTAQQSIKQNKNDGRHLILDEIKDHLADLKIVLHNEHGDLNIPLRSKKYAYELWLLATGFFIMSFFLPPLALLASICSFAASLIILRQHKDYNFWRLIPTVLLALLACVLPFVPSLEILKMAIPLFDEGLAWMQQFKDVASYIATALSTISIPGIIFTLYDKIKSLILPINNIAEINKRFAPQDVLFVPSSDSRDVNNIAVRTVSVVPDKQVAPEYVTTLAQTR